MNRHEDALKLLYPLPMDVEMETYGGLLDDVLAKFDDIEKDVNPAESLTGLSMWENSYGLDHSGTIEERHQRLMAAYNADAGIAERYYVGLAAAMGFVVEIVHPPRMFRFGFSRFGQRIYSADRQYTVVVKVADYVSNSSELVKAYEREQIPFIVFEWEFIPVLENVLLSETGLPLLAETGELILVED